MTATAIRNHTELLNYLVEKYNLKSYLEIGVQNPANNFNKIKANYRVGVDPEINSVFVPGEICTDKTTKNEVGDYLNYYELDKTTSDDFFTERPRRAFSIIFIDGLHHADQVKRDFENSLRCLNKGGFIVIHDTLPEDESTTHVPRDSKMWHGDVYKFVFDLWDFDNIDFVTINMDCGCTVVWKKEGNHKNEQAKFLGEITWERYKEYRYSEMNIIQPDEIEKYF